MDRVPILRMGDFLLVTIQLDMHDRLALALQEDLSARLAQTRARGVLIDISALDTVDSFIARVLGSVAQIARVLDAETVLVGMRPAVAITLAEMGVGLSGMRTALDADKGMRILRSLLREGPADDPARE